MKKRLALLVMLFIAYQANAHNVWIEAVNDENNQYVVKFGHQHTEGYPAKKLEEVKYLSTEGEILPIDVVYSKQQEALFSLTNAAIVFLKFNNGIWSKLTNGRYVEKRKTEVPNALFSINPIKYGKAILVWQEQAFKAHQQPYELIPLHQPELGKPLAILVLKQGKPLKNVKVGEGEDKPFVLTDEKGIATIDVNAGENRVWAEFSEDTADNADYDKRSIEYLLTFKLNQ